MNAPPSPTATRAPAEQSTRSANSDSKWTHASLWRDGRDEIPLPSRAFDTLVYLIEHRDRLVHKNELVEAVWHDVVVTDDSLIHAISVIRRALGDDPSEPRYVQTVPRRGYRFVAEVEPVTARLALTRTSPRPGSWRRRQTTVADPAVPARMRSAR